MPLHPDLDAFLELANAAARPLSAMAPSEARRAYDQSTTMLDTPGADIPHEALVITCRDGHPMPARLYRGLGTAQPSPVLLFFHGGGYVLGGLASHDTLCRNLAAQSPCAVLAIDYRKAPEHRFPTAFQDAEDAHGWLRREGEALGLDMGRVAFGGDSVGGTLATALTIATRDAGQTQPVLQLLIYPCTSAWQDTASHQRLATGHLLERETLQWMFKQYLRDDQDRLDWRFAPLQASSLAHLAPAHIVLAEYDPLIDEGQLYAARLEAAGVRTTVKVHEGMVHDFARLGNVVSEAQDLHRELARHLATAFG